ncbi:hypothetical protein JZM24_03545 [Candidatus Sodalis endolongispinus]|uniref:Inner membrane protein n=1 Tax=Candidatus Sodalis endolongispinus TaxID=2812662 RepID=A0ABS5Y8X7_9GAMM|nr:hypothetical protein [Candidatus Sodalis endolongispinus]MBT9431465.1 hypothetical protein [Candidatus Sodalis endolongispinus]
MSLLDLPRFSPGFVLVVSLLTFMLWCVMPVAPLIHLVEEGQLVENLTLVACAITLLCLLVLPLKGVRWSTRLAVWIALLAMMAREADLHKYIDHMSMLKLRFWTGPMPALDKLYALLSLAPIAIACLYFLIRYSRPLLRDITARKSYAITIATFMALIFITNVLDRSLGEFKETLGWHAPLWLVALQTSQEEFLELLLPVLALTAALQYRRQTRTALADYPLDMPSRV